MDTDNTPSALDDDVSDEELAAALALIKKRRADAARQQAEQTPPPSLALGESPPTPSLAGPRATPPATGGGANTVPLPRSGDTVQRDAAKTDVWPLAPSSRREAATRSSGLAALMPEDLPPPVVGECPQCKRKLLTRTSMLCNWCGAKINNPDYQEQAARTRQEMDAAIRETAEQRVQAAAQRGLLGRLKKRLKPSDKSSQT